VNRGPSHAGGLPAWERLVFGVLFALMAAFVVAVGVSAARSGPRDGPAGAGLPDGVPTLGGTAGSGLEQIATGGAAGSGHLAHPRRTALLDRRLAAALRQHDRAYPGRLAVGVIDLSTGAEAVYGGGLRFRAGGIATADILAALLLRSQQAESSLTTGEARLAVPMMDSGDESAASSIWRMAGAGPTVAAANRQLGLSHTKIGSARSWDSTRTTVTDQLRLLADLTSATSPLSSASRDYELGLMGDAQPSQRWGVCALAGPGTGCALSDGSVPGPASWTVNSIGVVEHRGHRLLIAVLSDDCATRQAGIAEISAAARAAAKVMTRAA